MSPTSSTTHELTNSKIRQVFGTGLVQARNMPGASGSLPDDVQIALEQRRARRIAKDAAAAAAESSTLANASASASA